MGRIFTIGLIVTCVSLPVWLSVSASEYPAELKKWLDSPVRYVLDHAAARGAGVLCQRHRVQVHYARAELADLFGGRR